MTPIRADTATVEPVSVAELRLYLRLDPEDDGVEDALLAGLIAAARASLETEARRVLAPGRWRIRLDTVPAKKWLPLPLSPLVALTKAARIAADGTTSDLPAGLVRLGPDPVEEPGLSFSPDFPDLNGAGLLLDVTAGFGGDGPPIPPALRLAILRLAAARYEHRGDEPDETGPDAARAAAPFRRLRL